MSVWITDNGSFKVEVVSSVHKDQYVSVWAWTDKDQRWVHVRDIRPDLRWSVSAIGVFLVRELKKLLDIRSLIEADAPDWELDAMEVKHG